MAFEESRDEEVAQAKLRSVDSPSLYLFRDLPISAAISRKKPQFMRVGAFSECNHVPQNGGSLKV